MLNGAVLYQGGAPLPNDNTSGPNGAGNWGSYTWQFDASLLREGGQTLSITNLDPSGRIDYPIFFMVDRVNITWASPKIIDSFTQSKEQMLELAFAFCLQRGS